MTDFLAEKRQEIKNRLDEIRPLVDEAARLEAALTALDGATGRPATAPAPRRGGTRKTGKTSRTKKSGGTGRPGRGRGSGKRSQEALALITKQPGITISEMAKTMGIRQNYLYRIVPALEKEGKVRKEGRGWHLVG